MPISIVRFDMRRPDFSKASAPDLYAAALDMAAYADEKGMTGITLSEHHGTDDGYLPAPLALAGCMLGRTKNIRIAVAALLVSAARSAGAGRAARRARPGQRRPRRHHRGPRLPPRGVRDDGSRVEAPRQAPRRVSRDPHARVDGRSLRVSRAPRPGHAPPRNGAASSRIRRGAVSGGRAACGAVRASVPAVQRQPGAGRGLPEGLRRGGHGRPC